MALDPKPVKVLVSGDVEGRFDILFKRVTQVNKKVGPFDLLLCVGEFFGLSPEGNARILSGEIAPPLPTYILGPCSPQTTEFYPDSATDIGPNLTFLGRKGQLNTASGLSIAFLSGSQSENVDQWKFNEDTVAELLVTATATIGYIGVDILMTSQWPKQVEKYGNNKPNKAVDSSDLVSKVGAVLKPRYHFAGLAGVHYERQPYRNHRVLQESAQHCTRFIGLAKVGNVDKDKFLYAFTMTPMRQLTRNQLTEQPSDASEFPYAQIIRDLTLKEQMREKEKENTKEKPQYFFDTNATQDDDRGRRGQKRGYQGNHHGDHSGPKRPAGPCWFCLSSPDVEKHLVVSIADTCYLALAKGGLTSTHVLILPIGHIQSVVAAPSDVRSTIDNYKQALIKCFATQGKSVVFFERNYRTQHLQIQVVPVAKNVMKSLKSIFMNEAEMKGIELNEIEENQQIWDLLNEGCPYFLAQLPDGTKLFTRQMKQFPIQFGREVLASGPVLNMPERADWKSCSTDKQTEIENANDFKTLFAKFDIAAEEDD